MTVLPSTSLAGLSAHIVDTHHAYLRQSLPQIASHIAGLRQDVGPGTLLDSLASAFAAMRAELETHMRKEEMILFPFIALVERAIAEGAPLPEPPFGSVANPIRMMEQEHDSAFTALAGIRRLGAEMALHGPLNGLLAEFEQDLQQHVHLENDILFPAAIAMENGGRAK